MNKQYQIFLGLLFVCKMAANSTVLNNHNPVDIFSCITIPIDQVTDPFTVKIFDQIDQLYGKECGYDAYQVLHIKKTYLYLIFLTKLEKAETETKYNLFAQEFKKIMGQNKTALPSIVDAAILQSNAWKSVPVSIQDLQKSKMWQLYLQSSISDIYTYFVMVLEILHNTEKQMFNYLPHYEVSFYDADFTDLRTLSEMSRIKIEVEKNVLSLMLRSCTDWKNLPSLQNPATIKEQSLESTIVQFKNSEFYKKTHEAVQLDGSAIASSASQIDKFVSSGIERDYIWCYFMIYESVGQITMRMQSNNLLKILKACSQSLLLPKLNPYSVDDYVLLDELLSVKAKSENKHHQSIHPTPPTYYIENIRKPSTLNQTYRSNIDEIQAKINEMKKNRVVAQSLWSDIGHAFSSAFHAIAHAVTDAYDAVKDIVVAAAVGIAGIGAEIVGQTEFAHEMFENESKEFTKAVNNLNDCIDNFTKSLENGIVAPVTMVTGDLVGFITNDQKIGADTASVISSVNDAILNVADKALDVGVDAVGATGQELTQAAEVASQLPVIIATAAWAIFSKQGQDEFLKQGEDLGKLCLMSIAQAYTTFKKPTMAVISSTMQGLGIITNALTTIFIDITREVTYIFTGGIFNVLRLSSIPGLKQAVAYSQQEADNVTRTLTAHRAVINTVMGVVSCIAVDAVTGGAAVETNAAILSDLAAQGAEAGAEAGVQIGEDAAVSTGESVGLDAGQEGSTIGKIAKSSIESVKSGGRSLKNSVQSFANKIVQTTSEKITQQIEDIKAFGSNVVKSLKNVSAMLRSGTLLEQATAQVAQAEQALTVAQEALENIATDGSADVQAAAKQAVVKAKQDVADAQARVQEVEDLNKLSTWQKTKNFTKFVGSGLSKGLKPIGFLMNITFNIGNIIAGANQDAKNALELQSQSETLQSLWSFLNNNRIATMQSQQEYLKEMNDKVMRQIGNQALAIALSSNIENQQFLQIRSALATYLAPLYMQLLLPPEGKIALGNIGSLWNFNSVYYNLYPSQGFYTVTQGRPNFPYAQEIAQAPSVTNLIVGSDQAGNKLWFNQRCTARDIKSVDGTLKKADDPLTVQFDFSIVYTLPSQFYLGLYLAGNYHDYNNPEYAASYLNNISMSAAQQQLFDPVSGSGSIDPKYINPAIVDLDEAHLAKMVILYRDSAKSLLMLGVYEHEGLGWILKEPLPVQFQLNHEHVYSISATLDKDQLKIELSVNNSNTPVVHKTIAVSPSINQRTYGVITSSVAAQWNQYLPTISIDNSLQKNNNQSNEIAREKKNKILLHQALNPIFADFNLKPLSKQSILLGQYVYGTENTDLKKIGGQNSVDFVVFGIDNPGQDMQIGVSPMQALKSSKPVLISLINGSIYDSSGKNIGAIADVFKQYCLMAYCNHSALINYITKQRLAIEEKMAHIKFGSFNLDIAQASLLSKGQYLYNCVQTLTDKQGNVIINPITKKPYIDYVVCASFDQNSLTIGFCPTSTQANALYSLVSGNIYAKNSILEKGKAVAAIGSQDNIFAQFGTYSAQYGIDPSDLLYQDINNAIQAYLSYQPAVKATSAFKPAQMVRALVAHKNNFKHGFAFPLKAAKSIAIFDAPTSTKFSLAQRQKVAAGKTGFSIS